MQREFNKDFQTMSEVFNRLQQLPHITKRKAITSRKNFGN